MQSVARFRVVSPLLAVHPPDRKGKFVTVPTGSIIETRDDIGSPGLIEIRLDDEQLLAFTRDIKERAEVVDEGVFEIVGQA